MSKTSLGLLVLRVVTGAAFISHGYPKLFGGEGRTPPAVLSKVYGPNFAGAVERGGQEKFAKGLESMGVPNPPIAAAAAGLAEFGGGVALILGFKTRLAALGIIGTMSVAIRKAHWEKGFVGQGGYELAFQFLATAVTLLITGPGGFSLDALFRRGSKTEVDPSDLDAVLEG